MLLSVFRLPTLVGTGNRLSHLRNLATKVIITCNLDSHLTLHELRQLCCIDSRELSTFDDAQVEVGLRPGIHGSVGNFGGSNHVAIHQA